MLTLTCRTAPINAAVRKKPRQAPDSLLKPRLSVEERLTKAFSGLCCLNELSAMNLDGIITKAEHDQLLAERKYIDDDSPVEIDAVRARTMKA